MYNSPLSVRYGLISIHAPRGGSDLLLETFGYPPTYFNPRSPWGERLIYPPLPPAGYIISIHAPRGGSDCMPVRDV